jgi:hypothetical protein
MQEKKCVNNSFWQYSFFFLISINVTHESTCKHTEEEKKDRFYTRYVGVRST